MSIIGRTIAKSAIVMGQSIITSLASYATCNAVDMYVAPDLKDVPEEEQPEVIENFNKKMAVVKPALCIVEGALIGATANVAIDMVDCKASKKAEDTAGKESGYLIGCNYLI